MLNIGLLVATAWIAVLVFAVALCRASARADDAMDAPLGANAGHRRAAPEPVPALSTPPRGAGQPVAAMSRLTLVH